MHLYSRRKILGMSAASLVGIAGCSGSDEPENNSGGNPDSGSEETTIPDTDGDGVPDSRDDYPNDSNLSRKQTMSDTRNLEEDHWRYFPLEFDSSGSLNYDFIVRDGPAIDAIVLEESEYSYFDNGERYEYIPSLSTMDTTGDEVSGRIPSGSYYLVFDNSNRGEATPPTNFSNDVITVEYEIEIGQ